MEITKQINHVNDIPFLSDMCYLRFLPPPLATKAKRIQPCDLWHSENECLFLALLLVLIDIALFYGPLITISAVVVLGWDTHTSKWLRPSVASAPAQQESRSTKWQCFPLKTRHISYQTALTAHIPTYIFGNCSNILACLADIVYLRAVFEYVSGWGTDRTKRALFWWRADDNFR